MRSGRSLDRPRAVLAALWGVCAMAGGCMVGPNYARPAVEQPAHFKSQADSEPAPDIAREWWRLYGDPELDRLIATATASSQTLRQAVARVDEARALARVAASFLFPTVSTNPGFTHLRTSGNRDSTVTGKRVHQGAPVNDWLLPVDLTYEIDVGGRVRRWFESPRAQAAATASDAGLVRLTVETDVAQFYYSLRSLDAQLQILTDNVAAYREQIRLLSVQLKAGLISAIVVNQAQAQLQTTLAQQRDVERARASLEHALAILCGQPAPSFAVARNPLHESAPPALPPGLPAQLLARRPDVAAAKARYRQAVAAYVNQVLIAYGDVEDALTDLHALSDEVGTLREAVSASQNYLRLAQVQYKQGLADYLIVIDAERTLLASQLSLAQAVNLQMGASIRLIKALGGGWNPSGAPSPR